MNTNTNKETRRSLKRHLLKEEAKTYTETRRIEKIVKDKAAKGEEDHGGYWERRAIRAESEWSAVYNIIIEYYGSGFSDWYAAEIED